jgi:hypothetical protein
MLGGITKYLQRHHIALLALFLALGGTSFAAASFINGKQIKPGSLPKNRLTKKAIKSLKGNKGAQGLPGQRGPTGPLGPSNPNASTLQGFPATSLARATTVSAGAGADPCNGNIGTGFSNFQSTTFTNTVSKSVAAPVAGVLVIFGHVSSEFSSTSGTGTIRLLGRLAVDGAQKGQEGEASLSSTAASCQEGRTIALDAAVAVAAGNHTVAFQIAKSSTTGGTGGAYVGNASVTTLFVPFGNAGSQGILGSHTPASHSGVSNH